MSVKYVFNKNSMDVIMSTVRRKQCSPSKAVDYLLADPQLLIEVIDDIRKLQHHREK